MTYEEAKRAQPLAELVYNVLIKLGWEKWTPQVGEWCVDSRELLLLILDVWNQGRHIRIWNFSKVVVSMSKEVTPILEWEVIEKILERAGYDMILIKLQGYVKCRIFEKGKKFEPPVVLEQRKDRLTVVYEAVLKLGKENKND